MSFQGDEEDLSQWSELQRDDFGRLYRDRLENGKWIYEFETPDSEGPRGNPLGIPRTSGIIPPGQGKPSFDSKESFDSNYTHTESQSGLRNALNTNQGWNEPLDATVSRNLGDMQLSSRTQRQTLSMVDASGRPTYNQGRRREYGVKDVNERHPYAGPGYTVPQLISPQGGDSSLPSMKSLQDQYDVPLLPNDVSASGPSPLNRTNSTYITPGGPLGDALHKDYKVHHASDFQLGKVFKILWVEPTSQEGPGYTEKIPIKHQQVCYASIRRFIVAVKKDGHCLCLPILTYGGQATKKNGVKVQDHAIVYIKKSSSTKKSEPPKEQRGEEKLSKTAIRIVGNTPRDRLDEKSRLNYAKIYTVEYNVRVCFIGKIHAKSMKYFTRDYNANHGLLPEEPNTEYSEDEDDENEG